MRRLPVIALLIAIPFAPTQAGERTHYLDLINRAHDRVVAVAATPAGDAAWSDLRLGDAVPGGGGVATVEVAGDQCLHDVRVEFATGRRALYPSVDLCRHRGLRIQPLPAHTEKALVAVQQDAPAAAAPPAE